MIFKELHSLLASGLDFSRTFGILIDGERDQKTKQALETVYASVIRGHSLWQSLAAESWFSALDAGVIKIGEETGKLDEALEFLAEYYRKKIAQNRMVWGALSYPLVILFTALAVVVFMILVIVPMFEGVYARMGGELPAITRGIIALSADFPAYLFSVLTLIIGLIVIKIIYGKTDKYKEVTSALILKTPIAGILIRKSLQAQFCKLLHLLYSSGVPLLQGIEMLEGIIKFHPYTTSFGSVADSLRHGGLLADSLSKFPDIYDAKLIVLLRVGEETGRLAQMLDGEGSELTAELEHRLKQLGNILEPTLIMIVGILVAVILIAMYMPMFKLGTVIG